MNTNKPSVEFDLWLSRKILVPDAELTNIIDWHPTANIMHAIALLETFMKQHQDRYTHVEFGYDADADKPWVVYMCAETYDDHISEGYPLSMMICQTLKMAIESLEMSTGRQKG